VTEIMGNSFRVGLTRDCLSRDGRTPVFDPAAFAVLRAVKSRAFEILDAGGSAAARRKIASGVQS
jgi:hypothetical protein